MFYGKYYYRAEFNLPAAYKMRFVGKKTYDEFVKFCKADLERRRKDTNKWKWAYDNLYQEEALLEDKCHAVYYLHQSCQRHKGHISTRIEGGKLRIFTKTAEDLCDILDYCKVSSKKYLTNIHQPASLEAVELLNNSVIFLKNPKYPYRVSIKEGQYGLQTKQQILNYVNNHPDSIFVSKGVMSQLSEGKRYMGGYFHVNDLSILTFLTMISPRFVGKIYRLEKAE